MKKKENRDLPSRRSFLQLSAGATAVATVGLRAFSEPMLARAAQPDHSRHPAANGAVMIDSNENPLGPSANARTALAGIIAQGGRYSDWMTDDLVKTFAQSEGLKEDSIRVFAGSTEPLHYTVMAFTSPSKSYVTADPGFESGMFTAKYSGARVVKVPLTTNHEHDVKAMLAAASDAGVFYICSPNNPTGSLTSHSDIEYLLAHKPNGSIVLADEAYIHFSNAPSAMDLVKADKDVILLRTFSKIYGMAGLRCGFAVGRPDLLEKMTNYGGSNFMPITALAAATASLKDPQLIAERRKINADIREQTFQWLDKNKYSYVRSESNCFMVDTKRPAKQVIDAMAKQNVFIGRIWPVWPTYARITVGTQSEMERFQDVFQHVMNGSSTSYFLPAQETLRAANGTNRIPKLS